MLKYQKKLLECSVLYYLDASESRRRERRKKKYNKNMLTDRLSGIFHEKMRTHVCAVLQVIRDKTVQPVQSRDCRERYFTLNSQ